MLFECVYHEKALIQREKTKRCILSLCQHRSGSSHFISWSSRIHCRPLFAAALPGTCICFISSRLIADSQTRRLSFSFDLHVIVTARSFRDLAVPLILSKPKDPGWSSLIPTLQLQLNTINEDTISGMEKFQTGKTNDLGFLPGLMIDGNREVMQIFAIRTEVRGKSLKISGSVICQRKLLA